MANGINRREALTSIFISATALQFGPWDIGRAQRLENPIEIGELNRLQNEWDTIPFKTADENALLVRVPKPSEVLLKSGRIVQSGKVFVIAYTLTCTHEGCDVSSPNRQQMTCGCHGSRFNAADGSVLEGPAGSPLKGIKLEVKNGKVFAVGAFT
jgi:Rieske Fe-S protein